MKVVVLVKVGDDFFFGGKLVEVRVKYQEVQGLKFLQEVQQKIMDIDKFFVVIEQDKVVKKVNYEKVMFEGEFLFIVGKYEEVKGKFNEVFVIDFFQMKLKDCIIDVDKKMVEGFVVVEKK